jgi:hypothetical protein
MPFITLNNSWSNLASYYNQNFINKPEIPKDSDQYKLQDDGLSRGGVINTALSVKKDTSRISNFLYKTDKGTLFNIKQTGLFLSNPLLEQPGKQKFLSIGTTRAYNGGVNLLASVAGSPFGLHVTNFGLTPLSDYNYAKIAKENNQNSVFQISSNPPVSSDLNITPSNITSLLNVTVTDKKNTIKTSSNYSKAPNRLINYLGKLIDNDNSTNPITLQSYVGGPESIYGLISTTIKTTGDSITNKSDTINNFSPNSYGKIYTIGDNLKQNSDTEYINYYNDKGNKTYIPLEYNYGVSHNKGEKSNSVDSINAINIIGSKTFYDSITKKASDVGGNFSNDNVEQNSIFGKDIIKFRIEILNNNQPIFGGTTNTEVYAFRAYINELNDSMDAKWDSYRYMGRGEEFYVYNGFTRDISVAFTMFAHSQPEMKILYQKLNNLMSSFAPDYSSAGLMRGNIGYLTVGDYLYRVPGVFTSIKLSNFLETHWETNLGGNEYELPKLITANLSFKPIHSFVPRRNYAGQEKSAFITPDTTTYSDQGIGRIFGNQLQNKYMPSIQRNVK